MSQMSQTTVVVDAIQAMIADGAVGPGDKLPIESTLAEQFGVSRGSLREGIRALVAMGVLETRQGSGTTVTSLDPGLLLDPLVFWAGLQAGESAATIQVARRALEVEAAGLAATMIDADTLATLDQLLTRASSAIAVHDHEAAMEADLHFHRRIAEVSRNPVLAALIEALARPSVRERIWQSIHRAGRLEATEGEHRAILAALTGHDPTAARAAMYSHLSQAVHHVGD